jgi:hypothetical protein
VDAQFGCDHWEPEKTTAADVARRRDLARRKRLRHDKRKREKEEREREQAEFVRTFTPTQERST